LLAAKADEMQTARQRLTELQLELSTIESISDNFGLLPQAEREERQDIEVALRAVEERRARQKEQLRLTLARLDAVLAILPPPFDPLTLADAAAALDRAAAAHASAQRGQQEALRQAQTLADARAQQVRLADRRAAATRRGARIENAVGDWTLLARCMSNDGLIALAIDDAGPALSALTNDLLLACYGPRFTVSILTQSETAKGVMREDFDIMVHDAQSGESKSVRLMSGGERVWINECLVRAVALYLAQIGERHYGTLLSDEVDGALDPERKRMFGAMKRQVLRLGGYQREFFISQTPELAGMADVVIDLDALKASAQVDAASAGM
jgi:exonuclease SbcC